MEIYDEEENAEYNIIEEYEDSPAFISFPTPPATDEPIPAVPTRFKSPLQFTNTASDNPYEGVEFNELEKYIVLNTKRKNLTKTQRNRLRNIVEVAVRIGKIDKYPSPSELYEKSKLFQAYVADKITVWETFRVKASRSRIDVNGLCNSIADYSHQYGWLAYKEKASAGNTRTQVGETDINDAFQPGEIGYVSPQEES